MMTTVQDILLVKGVTVPPFMHPTRTLLMDTFMDILLGVEHHCPRCAESNLVYDLCETCAEEVQPLFDDLHSDMDMLDDDDLPF